MYTKAKMMIEDSGLKCAHIAHAMGISPSMLSFLLHGYRTWQPYQTRQLAKILRCKVSDLQ